MREFQVGDKVRIVPEWIDELRSEDNSNPWAIRGCDYVYEIVGVSGDEDECYPYRLTEGTCWWGADKLMLADEIYVSADVSALL